MGSLDVGRGWGEDFREAAMTRVGKPLRRHNVVVGSKTQQYTFYRGSTRKQKIPCWQLFPTFDHVRQRPPAI
eukprot:scaffold7415_cov170-Amphora_coffeaeformis.AAC.16